MGKTKTKMNKVKRFRKELKRSFVTAIVAAFGFLTALAWRDVIQGFVDKITGVSPVQGKILTAIVITIIAAIVILLITKISSD